MPSSSVERSAINNYARYLNARAGSSFAALGGDLFSANGYNYHVFKSSSTLVVNSNLSVDVLVIGGGGGGGNQAGAGGGAGGLLSSYNLSLSPQSYSVLVGAGGPAQVLNQVSSVSTGTNSSFSSSTSYGGGGGAGYNNGTTSQLGASGGSGGGSWSNNTVGAATSGQGFSGGNGTPNGSFYSESSGGGGGFNGVGLNGSSSSSGAGGPGTLDFSTWGIVTSTGELSSLYRYFAGGGGAGSPSSSGAANTFGAGGIGGGGRGGQSGSPINGTSGIANTGGGGGGSSYSGQPGTIGSAGNGGSGLVIIRYQTSNSIWTADSNSSNLRLAMPLSTFSGIGDYTSRIRSGITASQTERQGNVRLSSSVSKFYDASLDCGAYNSGKYVSVTNNSNLWLTNQDFTIEGWWYFTANNVGYQALASHSGDSADQQNGWILITETGGQIYFYASDNGGWDVGITSSTIPTTGVWHHIAVTRSGSTFRLFYDGTQIGTATTSATITSPTSRELRVGGYQYFPGGARNFNGYIQDFKMYVGIAKYTSNFSVPTAGIHS